MTVIIQYAWNLSSVYLDMLISRYVSNILQDGNSTVVSVASKKGFSSHNERFYEEYEYEKKLKKRKARLVTAAEDAFTHIRRMQEHQLGRHFDKIIEIQIKYE